MSERKMPGCGVRHVFGQRRRLALPLGILLCLVLVMPLGLLGGCAAGYYWQAAAGQAKVLWQREPVAEMLARPDLDPRLRARLLLSRQVLAFAHDELLLPDNGSYTTYYDIGGPHIVWNVVAAAEFDLKPKTWCFPVAGCVAYRGYFAQQHAARYAEQLAASGYDIYLGGVAAYSTLGRFKDPILSSMVSYSDDHFAALLFHELAHQRLYIKDSTAFNEGFASVVEHIGLERWRAARGEPPTAARVELLAQRRAVMQLLDATRQRLSEVYDSDVNVAAKREQKAAVIAAMRERYVHLTSDTGGAGKLARPYEAVIMGEFNNAALAAIGSYQDLVPAFRMMLSDCEAQLDCFFTRAAALGEMASVQREQQLDRLLLRASVGASLDTVAVPPP